MAYRKILVVSDNLHILEFFIGLISEQELDKDRSFHFVCSPKNTTLGGKKIGQYTIGQFDIKQDYQKVIEEYELVISAHCKQLFPTELVERRDCINVHPGLNPYNRGWFPQVFSILNGLPLGATIHKIDAEIDHGNVIVQREVPVYSWDTSLTAYNRVQQAEEHLLRENLSSILNDTYQAAPAHEGGNLNLKKDFDALLELKLDETLTLGQAIDRLRALTHPPYRNAYFIDPDSGARVYVKISLEKESDNGRTE